MTQELTPTSTYEVSDSRFTIDGNGVLRNLIELDRDPLTGGEPVVFLAIRARDNGFPSNEILNSIVINLIDINDNDPSARPPFMADVVDGSEIGTVVTRVNAEDADTGANAELVFVLGFPSDIFAINTTSGVVTLIQNIFLTSSMPERYELVVNISDSGIPSRVSSQQYTIVVVSSVPQFSQGQFSFDFSENLFEQVVGIIFASDRDNNPFNDQFVYAIETISPYNAGFTLVSNGTSAVLLSPSSYLDFEDAMYFNLTLTVSRENMTEMIDDRTTVLVTIIDSNDNVPRLSPLNISIELPESTSNGTTIGAAVAIDFDTGPSGMIVFNHSGFGAEYFTFDASGNFIVINSGAVDFETDSTFLFIYQACDQGIPQQCSESGFIYIQVTNVDDLPPVFNPPTYEEMISEAFETNQLILYVNFFDPDTTLEDIVLTLDPPQTQFRIELLSGSGALMTTDIPLDRESLGVHRFNVVARDTASATATASVTITVLDENDERPFVDPQDVVVIFQENGPPVFPATFHSIVDRDDVSLYPLTNVTVSLRPSPTSQETYPITGGFCDHQNYTLLFEDNVHDLCGLEGCNYLLRGADVSIPNGGSLVGGVLELPRTFDIARNPAVLLDGDRFAEFTITLWVRFTQQSSGIIYEVQSRTVNVFGVSVETDGSLTVFVNPTATSTEVLLQTGPLNSQDGYWHQIGLVREGANLTMYFDCENVMAAVINETLQTPFTRSVFEDGSFFIGNRLAGGFFSEFYFCSTPSTNEHICCTLTCGESLGILTLPQDVRGTVDLRTRSVHLDYIGTENNASITQLQEAMRNIFYFNILDEPHPLDRGLLFQVYDMVGVSDQETVIILRPDLINDQRPVLDLNGQDSPGIDFGTTYNETSQGTGIIGAEAILYDKDSGYWPIDRITIQLVGTIPPLEALFLASSPPSLVVNVVDNTQIEIISQGALHYPDDFIDALRRVQYIDNEEEPVQFDRFINFTVYDEGSLHTNDPVSYTTVTITPTNDRPELDLNTMDDTTPNTTATYMERSGSVYLLSEASLSITDPDSTIASGAIFAFMQRPDGELETLQLDENLLPAGVTVMYSFDLTSGILTIRGAYSFATWLDILQSVEYFNANSNPAELVEREISVVVQDDRGESSSPAFVTITVTVFNNPPILYLGGPNIEQFQTTYTEDGNCIPVVAPDFQIRDPDSEGIISIRVTLDRQNVDFSSESLSVTGSPLPQTTFVLSSFVIFSLMNTTIASAEDALRRVIYCNSADEPTSGGDRSIRFSVTDTGLITSGGTSLGSAFATGITTISLQRVNDVPELSFEPLNNISIRGIPTPIIDPDTIRVEDSDNDFFSQLLIFIINPQDGIDNEIIEFSRSLPENTISVGPFPAEGGRIFYNVTYLEGGAPTDRVVETISEVRYNNRADRITVDPPRTVCLQVRDFEVFSPLECVNVTISPPNNFDPIFAPANTNMNFQETDSLISIANLTATDGDTGLAGMISYSITQSVSFFFTVASFPNIFRIDSQTGELFADQGLDADTYTRHEVSITAADMGNPVRSAVVTLTINVDDVNDIAPTFTGTLPYIADPQREDQEPPRNIFTVRAEDFDVSTSNNRIASYGLENYQDLFAINSVGLITSIARLDAETQAEFVLNVSAVDSGVPPQTSYTTVFFTLLDFNDNPATVDQLAAAIYIIGGNSVSIGPAMRIVDPDLSPPTITQLSITLTPNSIDGSRTYDQCLVECQGARLATAGLLTPAVDLIELATFQSDQDSSPATFGTTQIGDANCPATSIRRGDTREQDGYGQIPRTSLLADFGHEEFSVSFVLSQVSEGFVLLATSASGNRDFGIWIRRRDIRYYYVYGENRMSVGTNPAQYRLSSSDPFTEFFAPGASNPITRHYTVVVRSSPSLQVEFYVDCTLLATVPLNGVPQQPSDGIDIFIGQSRPHPLNGGRLGGDIHGLYYHPTALSSSQVLDFCSCGLEALRLSRPLPSSISITTETDTNIVLRPSNALILQEDANSVLRGITYENTYPSPTREPDRELRFSISEETGISGQTIGRVKLVNADNNRPVIDLNGFQDAGQDNVVDYVEDAPPVVLAPSIRITRDIEDSETPTFERIIVELQNAAGTEETLSITSGSPFITSNITNSGSRVEITGPGIESDFTAALQTLVYANSDDNPDTSFVRRVAFTVVDTEGRMNSPLSIATVRLTAVNDPPEISISDVPGELFGTVRFEEGSGAISLIPNVTVSDVDDLNLASATVTLSSSPNPDTDSFQFTNTNPAIAVSTSDQQQLVLSGTASLADYREVLSSVMFNSIDSPFLDNSGSPESDPTRIVDIRIVDPSGTASANVQITVQFIPINDPPQISLANAVITFRDGDNSIFIASGANITDEDNRRLASVTVTLDDPQDGNQLTDGITSSRTLVFTEDTITNLVTSLRSVQYINPAAEPTTSPRMITIEVCDFVECTAETLTVLVEDTNDNPPEFSQSQYSITTAENLLPGTTIGSLSVSDDDRVSSTLTFTISNSVPFELSPSGTSVYLFTSESLDFEDVSTYNFNITVSDGLNQGFTQVSVTVEDVNEPPSIAFIPTSPSIVVGAGSETRLIQVDITVTDPDFVDSITRAQFTLRDVPSGSDETLDWTDEPGYTFDEVETNVFELSGSGSTAFLDVLQNVNYIAGLIVTELTLIREVAVVVFDADGLSSEEAIVTVSLASIPQFSQETYTVALLEEVVLVDFFQVNATVESGGDVIEYAVEPGNGVTINAATGYLSLTQALDFEREPFLEFQVYAIDALPPARTGTATINITVIDRNDAVPSVNELNNITVSTGVPVFPFSSITVTDIDTVGLIMRATVTVIGEEDLIPAPFSENECVDEYNVIDKMTQVCGLSTMSFIDLLDNLGSSEGSVTLTDSFSNIILTNSPANGYSEVTANFSAFDGPISEFTFALWLQVRSSGHIAYYGTPDSTERYFVMFYDASREQVVVTMKRAGLFGLSAQVRVNFQLPVTLDDGEYHFIMLQYVERNLVFVLDGLPVTSWAVVYKEEPFIGQVFGKSVT